jgi:hypothetical protein
MELQKLFLHMVIKSLVNEIVTEALETISPTILQEYYTSGSENSSSESDVEFLDSNEKSEEEPILKKAKKDPVIDTKSPRDSWSTKAAALYFLLHDMLGEKKSRFTAEIFGINKSTLSQWYSQKRYWGKWIPYVRSMSPEEAILCIPNEQTKAAYISRIAEIKSLGKLSTEVFEFNDEKIYLSAVSDGKSIQQKVALASKQPEKYVYVKKGAKTVTLSQGNASMLSHTTS